MKRITAYAIILLCCCIGLGLYLAKNTCYKDETFFSLGSIIRFNTNSLSANCECAGSLFRVKKCTYLSHTVIGMYDPIKSPTEELWTWSIPSDAEKLYQEAVSLQQSDPKAFQEKYGPKKSVQAQALDSLPTRQFRVLDQPGRILDTKPQIDAVTNIIRSSKESYCYQRLASNIRRPQLAFEQKLRQACGEGDLKQCKEASAQLRAALNPTKQLTELMSEPGTIYKQMGLLGEACKTAQLSLLMLDCLRGHCSNELLKVSTDYSVPKEYCSGARETCTFMDFFETACLGDFRACASLNLYRSHYVKKKSGKDSSIVAVKTRSSSAPQPTFRSPPPVHVQIPTDIPSPDDLRRQPLIHQILSKIPYTQREIDFKKIGNIFYPKTGEDNFELTCNKDSKNNLLFTVIDDEALYKRITVQIYATGEPASLLLLSYTPVQWLIEYPEQSNISKIMMGTIKGESTLEFRPLSKKGFPLPSSQNHEIARSPIPDDAQKVFKDLNPYNPVEDMDRIARITAGSLGANSLIHFSRNTRGAINLAIPRDHQLLCDLNQAYRETPTLAQIKKSELPCYIELEHKGFKPSKHCPEDFPEVALTLPSISDVVYDSKSKNYYAISSAQGPEFFEIHTPSGLMKRFIFNNEGGLTTFSFLTYHPELNQIIATRRDYHSVLDLNENTLKPYRKAPLPGRLAGAIAYHLAWDRYMQVKQDGIHLSRPNFLEDKVIEFSDQTKRKMEQLGLIGVRFQARGDYLIFDREPNDVAFRISDQTLFEVSK